jgi:hypothetical protein
LAIVQISQITNRKGLASDLPQLAGAELGWSTDTRQLWIGNGTLEDGAPVIGNTEILTEFSDILNFTTTYTYKGQAAGYTVQTGPTPGTPITNSLQNWLDQFASVLDFGAVGDGTTDCTDAINRALSQLYCQYPYTNPQIRRSLFFPAGVYRVTGSINIPPYATLYGEGINNSVITMDSGVMDYVARTADSLQNTGVNIGDGGATPPQYITISNMGFAHSGTTGSVFLVEDATNCRFQNVGFSGASDTGNLTTDANASIGVSFSSTPSLVCEQITFDGCIFSGLVWGVNTNQQTKSITICNSQFNILYRGIVLGFSEPPNDTGPTGTKIMGNMFDNIFTEGIVFGVYASLNASGHNIFYDVGNHFSGSSGTPATSIMLIQNSNNVSVSDLFERTNAFATTYPRIQLDDTITPATANVSQTSLALGNYIRQNGSSLELIAGASGATVTTVSTNQAVAFELNYTITGINASYPYRTGTLLVSSNNGSGNPTWSDDYVQNADTDIILSVTQSGTTVTVSYSSSSSSNNIINYSINYLA